MGYERDSKAYRVLVNGKIVVSKDVRFLEGELGYTAVGKPVVQGVGEVADPFGEEDGQEEDVGIERVVQVSQQIAADPIPVNPDLREMLLRARGLLQQLPAEDVEDQEAELPAAEPAPADAEAEGNLASENPEEGIAGEADEEGALARGGGRYELRERVFPPDRYAPGAYAVRFGPADRSPFDEGEQQVFRSADLHTPKHIGEALASPQVQYWKQAMQEELDAIQECDTYEIVDRPKDTKVIPLIWVYALKSNEFGDVIRFKARLVAQGCKQVDGVDCDQTFAPVSTHACRRVLLSLAASEDLVIHQVDIKTAFLNGELEEEVFVSQPPGYTNGNKNEVCRLKKALYGLKQAPRAWHKKLSKDLGEMGFKACRTDPGLFINSGVGDSRVYIVTYVDDLLVVGKTETVVESVKDDLKKRYKVHDLGEVKNFLGSEVKRDRAARRLSISNALKIKQLADSFEITEESRGYSTPMCKSFVPTELCHEEDGEEIVGAGTLLPDGNRYAELIGSLQYLANTTRPDVSQAVALLARYRGAPTTAHLKAGLRVVRYLLGTKEMGLVYGAVGNSELLGYVDSDFAGDLDTRKTTTGFVYMLNGSAVSWGSKKQQSVATSTVEAEYIAASHAIKEGVWLGSLLEELGHGLTRVQLMMDNMGCIANLQNHVLSKYTKHISVCYHQAREKVMWGQITPVYVHTEKNLADVFTKPLGCTSFMRHRDGLGLGIL